MSAGVTDSALASSCGPTTTISTCGARSRNKRAASMTSRYPFSHTSRPTTPQTIASSLHAPTRTQRSAGARVDVRPIEAGQVDAVAEQVQLRVGQTEAPQHREVLDVLDELGLRALRRDALQAVDDGTPRPRVAGLGVEPVDGVDHDGNAGEPRRRTARTRPGFGLCVCTMSGRSRENTRASSPKAATSFSGAIERVACCSGTWRTPSSVSRSTYGPGAETPMTS